RAQPRDREGGPRVAGGGRRMSEQRIRLARPGVGDEGRMAIVRAATEVFSERGYAATSIDDIADRLGSTKGRIYHYYRGKADVFLDVHRVAMELMLERLGEVARRDGSPPERLEAMAREHALLLMREFPLQVVAVQGVEMQRLREAGGEFVVT